MLRDRTTARDRAENPWFFGPHLGWGLCLSVPAAGADPASAPPGLPFSYGWEGGSGTALRTDPVTGLTGILLTQRMMTSPEPPAVAAGLLDRRLRRARTGRRRGWTGNRAASKAWPTGVTAGPGSNRPVVPLPAEVGRANQA